MCGAYQAQEPKLLERALALTEINTLLNLVTDVALEVSGHPDIVGRQARSAAACFRKGDFHLLLRQARPAFYQTAGQAYPARGSASSIFSTTTAM